MGKTVSLLNESNYNVYILPEARQKMELYCELCSQEVGWLAYVEKCAGLGFLITDCILLKQEVHATTTEIDPSALLDFWSNTPVEQQPKIKCWGHSHVNMAPNPSGQDDAQMDYFKDGNDWFIRLITNKKGDMNITIYDYKNGFVIKDDTLYTYNPNLGDLRKQIQDEIKEKVKEKESKIIYSSKTKNNITYYHPKKKENKTTPLLNNIEVKYVTSFDEVLNDPNYWQDVLSAV